MTIVLGMGIVVEWDTMKGHTESPFLIPTGCGCERNLVCGDMSKVYSEQAHAEMEEEHEIRIFLSRSGGRFFVTTTDAIVLDDGDYQNEIIPPDCDYPNSALRYLQDFVNLHFNTYNITYTLFN